MSKAVVPALAHHQMVKDGDAEQRAASLTAQGQERSSGLGVGSPLGWLCARRTALAFMHRWLEGFAGWTMLMVADPMLTVLMPITACFA